MEKGFVDFKTIKSRVSIISVLDHYGVRLRRVSQDCLRGKCPLPTHSSEKSTDSFSVSLSKNVWACQSDSCSATRAGKKGGDVIALVAAMESCSLRAAGLRLREWIGDSAPGLRSMATTATKPPREPVPNKPLSFKLSGIVHSHPYLKKRGITLETARTFGVGFYPGRGLMAGRVVIPIHDEHGRLVAYAGRAIDGSQPKYKFPRGFLKSQVLFNLHRVVGDSVIIVEGFFDCMKVWQAGFQNVVALMGCSLSQAQELLLVGRFHTITVLLDGDSAGQLAAETIGDRLRRNATVRIIATPIGRQPDDLDRREICELL